MKVSSDLEQTIFLSHKVYLPSIEAIYKMFWDISVVYCSGGGVGGNWHASPGIPKKMPVPPPLEMIPVLFSFNLRDLCCIYY